MKPCDLLTALVVTYWRGGVTQQTAAKLLAIRKAEFAELANGLLFVTIIERLGWRYFVERFHGTFPECDERSVRRPKLSGMGQGMRRFTDAELLTPPQPVTLDDVLNGNWRAPCPDKICAGNVIAPRPSFPRELPRVVGQQQFNRAA